MTDELSIIFIELSKLKEVLRKPVEEMTPLEKWSIFFGYVSEPEQRSVLNSILASKREIAMAGELLQSISKDDIERAKYLSHKKFITDMESDLYTARENGIIEGETKGKIEIARTMRSKGFTTEEIVSITRLSEDEVMLSQTNR